MIKGCQLSYKSNAEVYYHQKRDHTPADFEELRKYQIKHCVCGTTRQATDGKDYGECPNCKRIWCMKGDCSSNFLTKRSYVTHRQSRCSFAESELNDKCSKCGYSPKTRSGYIGACPTCGRYWCLIGCCPFESDTSNRVGTHQSKVH